MLISDIVYLIFLMILLFIVSLKKKKMKTFSIKQHFTNHKSFYYAFRSFIKDSHLHRVPMIQMIILITQEMLYTIIVMVY